MKEKCLDIALKAARHGCLSWDSIGNGRQRTNRKQLRSHVVTLFPLYNLLHIDDEMRSQQTTLTTLATVYSYQNRTNALAVHPCCGVLHSSGQYHLNIAVFQDGCRKFKVSQECLQGLFQAVQVESTMK